MRDQTSNTQIGGTYHGPVAMGRDVTVNVNQTDGADELRAQLAELRQLIAAHAGQVDARAQRDVDDIESEAAQPDPDPDRIRDTLTRLAGRVGAVGSLVAAVSRLGELVHRMLT
jgi:hypothetical protein